MTKKMNVATATTTNSGKRNNSTNNTTNQMNVENTKFEVANSESVEYGTSAAKSVVVGGQQVWRLVVNGVYYGCSNGSCDDKKLVVITDRKIGRNGVMVDYVQIEANEVIGYDDNYNAIYNFKCKKYHKRVELMGNVDSTVRNEYVDGPNGVCALQVADMDKINKSKFWCYGAIAMDEETYNEWGEWLNNAGIGILAVMVGDDGNVEETENNDATNYKETIEGQIIENAHNVCGDVKGFDFIVGYDKYGNSIHCDITMLDDGRKLITIYDPWRKHNTGDYDYQWRAVYDQNDAGVYADVAIDFIWRLVNTEK